MKIKEYTITKENLIALLKELTKSKVVIAPLRNEFDEVLLLPVKDVDKIVFDYRNTINNPKDYFLPQCEPLFSFLINGDSCEVRPLEGQEEFIIFGLRPCDTRALGLLDNFFKRKFEDSPYFRKRKSCLIFTLACREYFEDCFCNAAKSGPILEEGFDVQLIPIKDKFFIQIDPERLEAEKMLCYLDAAKEEDKKEVSDLRDKLLRYKSPFELNKVYQNLKNERVDPKVWQDIASRCQMCGLCLFICPTCSCFTVLDRIYPDDSRERVRQRDACYFLGFSRLAGGENPVKTNEEMVKRKYQHKLVQQIDEFGVSGCVGCGRCVSSCVGNVNWLQNIIKIAE